MKSDAITKEKDAGDYQPPILPTPKPKSFKKKRRKNQKDNASKKAKKSVTAHV